MTDDTIMCPRDPEDVRETLCRAVLDRWPIPAIWGTDDDETYYKSPDRSEFLIDSFGSGFRVVIERVDSRLARTSAQFADSASPAAVPEEET